MRDVVARVATLVLAFVVGGAYGAAATIAQSAFFGALPVGLVLAVVGSGALILSLRLLTGDRWTGLAGGVGVWAAASLFTLPGLGGSAILAAQTPATAWVPIAWSVAVPVMIALVVAWPDLSTLRPVAQDRTGAPT